MAMFWLALAMAGTYLLSWLMVVLMPLARAWVVARSTVKTHSTLSAGSRWCGSTGWAAMVACLPASLPRHCIAQCLVLAC
jgi:hypothetical protein